MLPQGEAATRRLTLRAGGQMCGKMTCWPDGQPAVKQEAPFPLTSFFQTEPTPAPTSRLHAENHIQRKESSGGNDQHISAVNDQMQIMYFIQKCSNGKIQQKKKVNHTQTHTRFLIPNLSLPLHTVPQSPSRHSRAVQKNWTAPQNSQDCHLGTWEQWRKTGRGEGDPGSVGAEEAAEVAESGN